MGRLVSVNVGLPRDVAWRGETVRTAIWKQALQGRRMVRRLNVAGDGQGDLAGHGGEHRAVMVYQMDSYRHWEAHLGRGDFAFGQFGENFTVEGLPDDEVCIGDRYRIAARIHEDQIDRRDIAIAGVALPGLAVAVITAKRISALGELVGVKGVFHLIRLEHWWVSNSSGWRRC
jgi:MOSC domain